MTIRKICFGIILLICTVFSKANTLDNLRISGVEKRISMAKVSQLWKTFEQAEHLHSTLKATPKKIYVLYNLFDKGYQQANVLIAYDVIDLTRYKHSKSVDFKNFTQILSKAHYTPEQLSNAWKSFDYRNKVNAVLEIHSLATLGNKEQTTLYVLYPTD